MEPNSRCSDLFRQLHRQSRRRAGDARGAILPLVAVSVVGLVGFGGLAIDLGRGYMDKLRLSRAVDAAVIEAASTLRLSQATARQYGEAVARLNGVENGVNGTSFVMEFGTNAEGEQTVSASASRPMNTVLMRILGQNQLQVSSSAIAAIPPIDMALVLDQSGSMTGPWNDLETAATNFVQKFDDTIDQMALIHFQIRANQGFPLGGFFTTPITSAISNISPNGDTNTGEGLRLALAEMQSPAIRDRAAKVVVFFTDGRPTAFRDSNLGTANDDAVMAVRRESFNWVRGLWYNPDGLSMTAVASGPDECDQDPICDGFDEDAVRARARLDGINVANQIRSQGVLVYTIGLGDPTEPNPLLQPDQDYLRLLANEGGIANPDQPQGRFYFAPSPDDLQDAFNQLAKDLLVRLAQ